MTSRLFLPAALAAALLVPAAGPRAAEAPGPLATAKLVQITLPVKDLDRSVAFYRDTLGLKLLGVGKTAAFLDASGFRLRLEKSDTALPSSAVEIYFNDPGMSRLKPLGERGVKFIGPPETVQRLPAADVQLAEFTDPDGNAIGLIGEVPRP
jgi:catechol 2,3-dioxygenase-like lactoylglutathione lyase family enzyme